MVANKLRWFLSIMILPALLLGGSLTFNPAAASLPAWDGPVFSPDSPATPDGEIGDNDVRVSYMGRDTQFDAYNPAMAYNSQNDEYLIVWHADDDDDYLADDEYEIYAQRVSAATGLPVGERIAVSHTGTNGYDYLDAYNPAVAYNSTDNQYLVVWEADLTTGGLVNDEFEIWGQYLTADGTKIFPDDVRISYMANNGDANYDATRPAVAYNSVLDQYLVVYQGDDNAAPLVNDEIEIFGTRMTINGFGIGVRDFRISDMGPDGDTSYSATSPAVAYSRSVNEYLVIWSGSDDNDGMVSGEHEIFGQRLDANCAEVGTNDFRISDMGGSGDASFNAYAPDVAYNSNDNQYLVVWYGDDNTGSLVDEEYEIYGQLMTSTGAGLGTNDFRISDMGPDGSIAYRAEYPAIIYNDYDYQFLVVWAGIDNVAPVEAGEQEIFGQRLTKDGAGSGNNDFRISIMGGSGNSPYWAYRPATAFSRGQDQYLVSWYGDDTHMPLIEGEYEIFTSRLASNGSIILSPYQMNRLSFMDPVGDPAFDAADPAIAFDAEMGEGPQVVWSGDTNTPSVEGEFEIYGTGYQEIRISRMGPDGVTSRGAYEPAIACNTTDHQYLVVWYGDDDTDNEYEIYGQLMDTFGGLIGVNFQISDMGPPGNIAYGAFSPDVVYNSVDNQYLVVWAGDDDTGSLVDNEYEIYGQILNADGSGAYSNDFRISDMGETGNAMYNAGNPAVAYNKDLDQYLVVWAGDDDSGSLVDNELEIYGQRMDNTGAGLGTNDFRISDMGGTGNASFDAVDPDVTYNTTDQQYLVVWSGDDNTSPLVDEEYEIFGQRLTASGGGVGSNDFRISFMGPSGDANYDAYAPAVDFAVDDHIYLVTWYGDDGGLLANDEYEIYGRFLTAAGVGMGTEHMRISDMGPDGDYRYRAANPAILTVSSPFYSTSIFMVLWEGDDDTPPLVNEEFEIFYQLLDKFDRMYLPLVSK